MRTFNVTWLAWYLCGVSALLAVAASLIAIVPPGEWVGQLVSAIFAGLAGISGIGGFVLGRLPPDHWTHQSQPLKIGMAGLAFLTTVLIVIVG